jgi:hypothetical protein
MRRDDGWNVQWIAGYVTALICPLCQTAEENAEAVVEEVLTDHSTSESISPATPDFVRALIEAYPTAEIMRHKADQLAGARPDCVAGPVQLMHRIADEMESEFRRLPGNDT